MADNKTDDVRYTRHPVGQQQAGIGPDMLERTWGRWKSLFEHSPPVLEGFSGEEIANLSLIVKTLGPVVTQFVSALRTGATQTCQSIHDGVITPMNANLYTGQEAATQSPVAAGGGYPT